MRLAKPCQSFAASRGLLLDARGLTVATWYDFYLLIDGLGTKLLTRSSRSARQSCVLQSIEVMGACPISIVKPGNSNCSAGAVDPAWSFLLFSAVSQSLRFMFDTAPVLFAGTSKEEQDRYRPMNVRTSYGEIGISSYAPCHN